MRGVGLGSYSAPRAASGEPRIKAVTTTAGSFDVPQTSGQL